MAEVAILLISEDGSKWACDTLEALSCSLFSWLTPRVEPGPWLGFAPVNEAARQAVSANRWKSKKARDARKILNLCRAIATHILREDGFVIFHVDGDCVWGEANSENVARFDEVIRAKVRDLVRGHLQTSRETEPNTQRIEAVMTRLILLAPHYAIETWLFANIRELRELGVIDDILNAWALDLSALDRVPHKIKLSPVSTRDYPRLAGKLACAKLYALDSSFTTAAHEASACGSLIVRLRAHWPDWVRAQYGLAPAPLNTHG